MMYNVIDIKEYFVFLKFLLPGNSITASCYRGSDEYWHASKLSGSTSTGRVSVDTSSKATVKGTIAKGTSEELLYLVVSNGTMQIKLDSATNFSRCPVLLVDKNVQVVCAVGSDEFYRAIQVISN